MYVFSKKTLAAIAGAGIIGFAVSGQAWAGAYGLGYMDIQDFTLTPSSGALVLTGAVTTSLSNTPNLNPGAVQSVGGVNPTDAPLGCADNNGGGFCGGVVNNSYPIGNPNQAGPSYAFDDSDLDATGIIQAAGFVPVPGTGGRATAISELNLAETGNGAAGAGNSLAAELTIDLTQAASIAIDFLAASQLRSFVDAASVGGVSNANTSFRIEIQDATLATVFEWEPDTAPMGGALGAAPFDMNEGTVAGVGTDDQLINALVAFGATTNVLPFGTYTLNVNVDVDTAANVQKADVPEPGAILLLSAGIAGMGFSLRRRQSLRSLR